MDRDGFGARLQKAMDDKGVTQADLVRLCEAIAPSVTINRSDISRYLAGKTSPRSDKLVVISKALDVPYNLLSGQSSNKFSPEISLGLECLCNASKCPSIYARAEGGGDKYVVYVSHPPEGNLDAAMSFFTAAGGALKDVDSAALAARIMRAIKAGGTEREILERLFPPDGETSAKRAQKEKYVVSDYPPKDAPQEPRKPAPRVIIRRRQK